MTARRLALAVFSVIAFVVAPAGGRAQSLDWPISRVSTAVLSGISRYEQSSCLMECRKGCWPGM